MAARRFLWAWLQCYALAAGLGVALLQSESRAAKFPNRAQSRLLAQSSSIEVRWQAPGALASAAPLPPEPSPADPRKLPAVFRQAAPKSIADLKAMEEHIKTLVAQVSPAVVEVEVGFAMGSGVVISTDGLVLTAGHVCGAANRDVRFRFPDGKTTRGKTLGVDSESDIGLMRITEEGPWPHAAMGELNNTRIGDWVLALGHPGGFDSKRSLVVRLGRIIRLARDLVQTDCTISSGDSGGPLFDMNGRVIGIHSAISASPAENFHVPVTFLYDHWNDLVKALDDPRPGGPSTSYIGASVIDQAGACRVSAVETSGPASEAGMKVDDLVLKVDGRDIKAAASFRRWLAETKPGEILNVEIQRGERVFSRQVTVRTVPVKE